MFKKNIFYYEKQLLSNMLNEIPKANLERKMVNYTFSGTKIKINAQKEGQRRRITHHNHSGRKL